MSFKPQREKIAHIQYLADNYPEHLCYRCKRAIDFYEGTTVDENWCPYAADIMYYDGERFGLNLRQSDETENKDNDRSFTTDKGTVLFKTVDNGMGYFITQCPFFQSIPQQNDNRIKIISSQLKETTSDLINLGVSPDIAANNAGYVAYAALGGEARKINAAFLQSNSQQKDENA